jgi:hypothetical protein
VAQSQIPTNFTLPAEQPVVLGWAFVQPGRAGARRWLAFIANAWREGIEMYASGGLRRGPPGWFG